MRVECYDPEIHQKFLHPTTMPEFDIRNKRITCDFVIELLLPLTKKRKITGNVWCPLQSNGCDNTVFAKLIVNKPVYIRCQGML